MLIASVVLLAAILLIVLDLVFPSFLTRAGISFVLLNLSSHCVLAGFAVSSLPAVSAMPPIGVILLCFAAFSFLAYFWLRLALYITPDVSGEGMRLRIMMGGRRLLVLSSVSMVVEAGVCVALYFLYKETELSLGIYIADCIVCWLLLILYSINGAIRIFFTSRRIGMLTRILLLCFLFVPIVNSIIVLCMCRPVRKEYTHELDMLEVQKARAKSLVCKTRYPILLLHGIGFVDSKVFNYWGRIPRLLKENGADIYYGNQQASGTIESCALEIKHAVMRILEETGCEKVNIIAHSKGGLDARYMISSLAMADKVASLTTISTPHRGSELAGAALRFPRLYAFAARIADRAFALLGDKHPDSFHAFAELAPDYMTGFNEQNPDAPGILYQSHSAAMKSLRSDGYLSVLFALMTFLSGDNDGLVSVESAKWGNYLGVITGEKAHGVSHADVIDMKRTDFEGMQICERYVELVSSLKAQGF